MLRIHEIHEQHITDKCYININDVTILVNITALASFLILKPCERITYKLYPLSQLDTLTTDLI